MPITVFSQNHGGIDISSSPISIPDNNATGQSYNYEYAQTGAITKVLGTTTLNGSADIQLNTLGLGVHHDVSSDSRTLVRAAGTKIQTVSTTTGSTTNQASDASGATTDFLPGTSTQPVVFAPFNTLTGGTQLWMAGGGLDNLVAFTGSQVTNNGVATFGGSITPVVNTHGGGDFSGLGTGTFYYAIQGRKSSTQAYSNVALDVSAIVVNNDDSVTIPLTAVTGIDTTLYDQIIIWRSALNGVSGFTTGSIIAQLASTATTYTDLGTSISDSENAPRAGNSVLDNSQLPTGTYNYVTTFKRRLVTAKDSTFYLSDLDKPESWPTPNAITIPTGGPITALGIIGVPSEYTTGADEYLCIFKEKELWVFVGTNADDWDLKQIDKTGCEGQSLVVAYNGFLSWIGFNGIYIWDGRGRPSRVSRPIFALFAQDGDLDIPNLKKGYGIYSEQKSQVTWRVSHRIKGVNSFSIKMDVRNTNNDVAANPQNPEINGTFLFDFDSTPYYGLVAMRPPTLQELIFAGDQKGHIYSLYTSSSMAVSFDYETKAFDMGYPEVLKQFKRVIVWLEKLTPNDLTMYYWADYRIRQEYQSLVKASMSPSKGTQPALWDIALWDQAFWDDYTPDISQVEFNLHSQENNCVGTSLKIKFEQLEAGAPVRIHAFAIEWEGMDNLPIPTGQVS